MSNLDAFLEVIAASEGTRHMGDRGYNVIVGGKLFHDYKDHPRVRVYLPRLGIYSTAAGRYQLLARNFDFYRDKLKLKDFSPSSQDAIAKQQLKECRALDAIEQGNIVAAVIATRHIWASFPGAGYGQREQTLKYLKGIFEQAGGKCNAS